jgi:hypothetical protein
MTDRNAPARGDPVGLMLRAAAVAVLARMRFLDALTEAARSCGVAADSELFDQAADAAGLPYCRALDLYVDRETKARAEAVHFTEAHRALSM